MESIITNYSDFSSTNIYNKKTQTEKQTQTESVTYIINYLAQDIDSFIQNNKENTEYILNEFGYIEIEGIPIEISIFRDNGDYKYNINAKKIVYDDEDADVDSDDEDDDKVTLFFRDDFMTVKELLQDLEEVIKTYTFIDCFLLSPIQKKRVFLQRAFLFSFSKQLCCVCENPTIEYTTCKHPICLQCRYHCLKVGNNICPVCRDGKLKIYPIELKSVLENN